MKNIARVVDEPGRRNHASHRWRHSTITFFRSRLGLRSLGRRESIRRFIDDLMPIPCSQGGEGLCRNGFAEKMDRAVNKQRVRSAGVAAGNPPRPSDTLPRSPERQGWAEIRPDTRY